MSKTDMSNKTVVGKPKTIRLPDTLGVIISTNIQNLGIFNYSSKMSSNDNRMFTSEDILFNSLVQLNDSDINKVTDYHSRISYFFNERNFYSLILKDNIGNFTKNIFEISNEKNEPRLSQINDNIGFNLNVTLETIFKPGETIRIDGRDYVILFYNILTANPIVVSKFDKNKQAAVNFNNIRYQDRKKLEKEAKKDVEDLGELLNFKEDEKKVDQNEDTSTTQSQVKVADSVLNVEGKKEDRKKGGGTGDKVDSKVKFADSEEKKQKDFFEKGFLNLIKNNLDESDSDSLNTISKTKYQIVIYLDLIEKQKYNPDQLRCTITKNHLTYHWNNILGSLVYQNLSLNTFKKKNSLNEKKGEVIKGNDIKENERLNEEEERKSKAIEKEKIRLRAEKEKARKKLKDDANRDNEKQIEADKQKAVQQEATRLREKEAADKAAKEEQEAVEKERLRAADEARVKAEEERVAQAKRVVDEARLRAEEAAKQEAARLKTDREAEQEAAILKVEQEAAAKRQKEEDDAIANKTLEAVEEARLKAEQDAIKETAARLKAEQEAAAKRQKEEDDAIANKTLEAVEEARLKAEQDAIKETAARLKAEQEVATNRKSEELTNRAKELVITTVDTLTTTTEAAARLKADQKAAKETEKDIQETANKITEEKNKITDQKRYSGELKPNIPTNKNIKSSYHPNYQKEVNTFHAPKIYENEILNKEGNSSSQINSPPLSKQNKTEEMQDLTPTKVGVQPITSNLSNSTTTPPPLEQQKTILQNQKKKEERTSEEYKVTNKIKTPLKNSDKKNTQTDYILQNCGKTYENITNKELIKIFRNIKKNLLDKSNIYDLTEDRIGRSSGLFSDIFKKLTKINYNEVINSHRNDDLIKHLVNKHCGNQSTKEWQITTPIERSRSRSRSNQTELPQVNPGNYRWRSQTQEYGSSSENSSLNSDIDRYIQTQDSIYSSSEDTGNIDEKFDNYKKKLISLLNKGTKPILSELKKNIDKLNTNISSLLEKTKKNYENTKEKHTTRDRDVFVAFLNILQHHFTILKDRLQLINNIDDEGIKISIRDLLFENGNEKNIIIKTLFTLKHGKNKIYFQDEKYDIYDRHQYFPFVCVKGKTKYREFCKILDENQKQRFGIVTKHIFVNTLPDDEFKKLHYYLNHILNLIKLLGFSTIGDKKNEVGNIENIMDVNNPYNYEEIKKQVEDDYTDRPTAGGSTKKHPLTKQYKHSTHKRTKKRRS